MHDLIGDTHGRVDSLRRLLAPARRAIFLGNFIEREP
jgi:hypothetical protein